VAWRLYVTNTNKEQLSLTEAVSADQEQWQPERGFHRFKKVAYLPYPFIFETKIRLRG